MLRSIQFMKKQLQTSFNYVGGEKKTENERGGSQSERNVWNEIIVVKVVIIE